MKRLIFSGHETFRCKTHWLKRGYDFIINGGNFNGDDAVVRLGVGKNMVSSIKYWMRAFGFIDSRNIPTDIAKFLLDDDTGRDPFFEDIGTLWLLHFYLINEEYATIYNSAFIEFHRIRNEIEKVKLHNFLKATCFEGDLSKLYNKNTVRKDVDVFLNSYCETGKENIEDQNTLLYPLNLIRQGASRDVWYFNSKRATNIPPEIFLYSILCINDLGARSVSFELLQKLSLIFCMNNNELLNIIEIVRSMYPSEIVFSDNAGIKELQFKRDFYAEEVLENYYKTSL